MILALETATELCSVSFMDRKGEFHEKRLQEKGSHSEYLFLFIRELMKEHDFKIKDLEEVLVSNGPGSYTGLRIAASAVKGMLFGTGVDVYAANTLAGFALAATEDQDNGSIHAVINARRKHLYHQEFVFEGKLKAQSNPGILELRKIEEQLKDGDCIIGTGTERLGENFLKRLTVYGLERTGATALIKLYKSESKPDFFTKTTAEALESNYISTSQVNDTAL